MMMEDGRSEDGAGHFGGGGRNSDFARRGNTFVKAGIVFRVFRTGHALLADNVEIWSDIVALLTSVAVVVRLVCWAVLDFGVVACQ